MTGNRLRDDKASAHGMPALPTELNSTLIQQMLSNKQQMFV